MMPTQNGSIRLFRLAGINVFLHWSWFIVAAIEVNSRLGQYSSAIWNLLEYVGLFTIVLLHEMGHSLACRQTGGRADQIVLWPLGGVAYVDAPQRPGATLWSIAAGPLVNLVLAPIFFGCFVLARVLHWPQTMPDLYELICAMLFIDVGLFLFNIFPVYPLDGGQILRSLLWFPLGRARSLLVATIVGFVGVGLFSIYALSALVNDKSFWLCIVSAFLAMNCWQGFRYAQALSKAAKVPRHTNLVCPDCKAAPPVGFFWQCGACQQPFDIFSSSGSCPQCGSFYEIGRCPDCGRTNPLTQWVSTDRPAKL